MTPTIQLTYPHTPAPCHGIGDKSEDTEKYQKDEIAKIAIHSRSDQMSGIVVICYQ